MKTADIERVIGHKPGADGFQVTAANTANVRDWMVSQGISRDRANACRASTLERAYRYPHELRKLLWRGDYKGENGHDINGTAKPRAMGANLGAQQPQHALAASTPKPDPAGEGIGGGSGETSLVDTIEGIICGEFTDDDVVRLLNACKAHLGE